jgi:hypothetical protein
VAPTLDWLCVPTGRNDQLIHVAFSKGDHHRSKRVIELVYWCSLQSISQSRGCTSGSARELAMAAQRAFDEAPPGNRHPYRPFGLGAEAGVVL